MDNTKHKCDICGSDYGDSYYKNEEDNTVICVDCLLESDMVTTSTTTHYFLDGDYIGNDEDDIEEVIDAICDYSSYKYIKEE